jgi:hypothetical protein
MKTTLGGSMRSESLVFHWVSAGQVWWTQKVYFSRFCAFVRVTRFARYVPSHPRDQTAGINPRFRALSVAWAAPGGLRQERRRDCGICARPVGRALFHHTRRARHLGRPGQAISDAVAWGCPRKRLFAGAPVSAEMPELRRTSNAVPRSLPAVWDVAQRCTPHGRPARNVTLPATVSS